MRNDSLVLYSQWLETDNRWWCCAFECRGYDAAGHAVSFALPLISVSLVAYLRQYGFSVSDEISYCLAECDGISLKYRRSGGIINIYIHK